MSVRAALRRFGPARGIILAFTLALFLAAAVLGADMPQIFSQSLWQIAVNMVLALSLVPMIRGGTGLNFGLPLGVIAGLLGIAAVLEWRLTGWSAFFAATGLGVFAAVPIGLVYALVVNAVRGNEMMVGIYFAWSVVSLFCVAWLLFPADNPEIVQTIGGSGLRQTLTLSGSFAKLLDDAFAPLETSLFGGFRIYAGLLLAVAAAFLLVAAFFRTRAGAAIHAAGANPRFAAAAGVRVGRARAGAVVLSTVLAAIGAVIYCQGYGLAQFYTAPLYMALPAVAAVLIGGASIHRIALAHVLVGVALFQSILTLAPAVLSAAVAGGGLTDAGEAIRATLQNGMILYALTRRGGGS